LGSEATPEAYLAAMVEVFRAIRRVLRDDGTCWVNIGDSYASAPCGSFNGGGFKDKSAQNGTRDMSGVATSGRMDKVKASGLKPKDLLLMPARLALALQADGWWVRSDIIWHKPNPMPESCTDRPTSAHEHVFLLSKAARYFYDAEAIRENVGQETRRNVGFRDVRYEQGNSRDNSTAVPYQSMPRDEPSLAGRSCRNVWTIPTHAYSDAHFATFPPALVERCIRAGTSERGCCAACGAPWLRMTERGAAVPLTPSDAGRKATWTIGDGERDPSSRTDTPLPRHYRPTLNTDWRASCQCDADVVPCTVLDPFVGSGTTALVADRLQRHAIGIDLSIDYAAMAQRRLEDDCPLFTEAVPVHPVETEIADLFSVAAD
jgi:DNA modification methylase